MRGLWRRGYPIGHYKGHKIKDALQVRDPARMHHSASDIVDQLLLNQIFAVPDAAENFTNSKRGCCMLADEAETLLIFSGDSKRRVKGTAKYPQSAQDTDPRGKG